MRIWTSFAKNFCCAYFVLCMAIPVLFRIVLTLLFILVQSLGLSVMIPVLFWIVLRLLFLLVRLLDLRVKIPVLFRIVLLLLFLFIRSFDLRMTIPLLFRIVLHISVSCFSTNLFSYHFLSISIDFFLIMLVEHLRTPRLSLTIYPNRCNYKK